MTDTSGPAFPYTSDQFAKGQEGMTRRFWLAGMAMQGLIASGYELENVAQEAHQQASHMLRYEQEEQTK